MVQDTEVASSASEAGGSGPHFLGDQPCTDPARIRFGHEVYVTALQGAVSACPTPFVIGLYGNWGTGKTTVLEGLREALHQVSRNRPGFEVCLFDAWKYSDEASFRRQFLAELNKQLELGWDLDSLLHRPKEEQKLDVGALRRNIRTACCTIVAVMLGLGAAYWALRILVGPQLASMLVAAAAGGILSIVILLVGIVFDLIKISTYRVTHPLIFAPEQFEEQFRGMLNKAKITDDKRLVVLIDNLDRCAPDAAVGALKTIKTFLEHKGCIFVVACDEDALIRHLTSERGGRKKATVESEAKEFLRKFFQSTIEVEPLSDDLRDFASELVEQAGMHPEVASVVWAVNPRDPRRILQFLNRLTLALHVVRAREASGRLPAGVISSNQPYLAKALELNEICGEFARACVTHPQLLSLAERTIKYPDMSEEDPLWLKYLSAEARQGKYRELYRFLEATIPIGADDPQVFFTGQMAALDMAIDDPSAFRDMLRRGLTKETATLISDVTDQAKLSRYREIMTRTIGGELDQGRAVEAFQASRVAVHCFDLLPEPRRPLANAVCYVLRGLDPKKDIPLFDPARLVGCISHASLSLANRGTEVAVASLDYTSPHTDELLEALQEHRALVDASRWGTVGDFFSAALSELPETGLRYLNAIDPECEAATSLFQRKPELLAQIAGMIASPEPALGDRALEALSRPR